MSGELIFAPPEGEGRGPRRPSWTVLFNITKNDAGGYTCNVIPSHGGRRAQNVGTAREAYEIVATWLAQSARQLAAELDRGEIHIIHP